MINILLAQANIAISLKTEKLMSSLFEILIGKHKDTSKEKNILNKNLLTFSTIDPNYIDMHPKSSQSKQLDFSADKKFKETCEKFSIFKNYKTGSHYVQKHAETGKLNVTNSRANLLFKHNKNRSCGDYKEYLGANYSNCSNNYLSTQTEIVHNEENFNSDPKKFSKKETKIMLSNSLIEISHRSKNEINNEEYDTTKSTTKNNDDNNNLFYNKYFNSKINQNEENAPLSKIVNNMVNLSSKKIEKKNKTKVSDSFLKSYDEEDTNIYRDLNEKVNNNALPIQENSKKQLNRITKLSFPNSLITTKESSFVKNNLFNNSLSLYDEQESDKKPKSINIKSFSRR